MALLRLSSSALALAAIVGAVALAAAPREEGDVEWPVNGGPGNARYSPLTQIDRRNVAELEVAWTYDSHDAFEGSEMQSNPIVVDGLLYVTTPTMKVVALDAETGREAWRFDPARKRRVDPRPVPSPWSGGPRGPRLRHLSKPPVGARSEDAADPSSPSGRTDGSISARDWESLPRASA